MNDSPTPPEATTPHPDGPPDPEDPRPGDAAASPADTDAAASPADTDAAASPADTAATRPRPSPRPRSDGETGGRTDDDPPETGRTDDAADRPDRPPLLRRGRPRPRTLIAAGSAVAALVGAGFAGADYWSLRAQETARTEVLDAATRFATQLASYEFDTLDTDLDAVLDHATGDFAEQYRRVGDDLSELIREHEAVSEGETLAAGVVRADPTEAVVLVFVDQTITNTDNPEPRIDRNRMRLTLRHDDDRWLVHHVELL